jgi:hypothetical protein
MQVSEGVECAPPRRALLSRAPRSFVTWELDYAMPRMSPRAEPEMLIDGSSVAGSKHYTGGTLEASIAQAGPQFHQVR